MIYFVVPLMPDNLRNELRDELWRLCRNSLINQKNQNWKAIIIGNDFLSTEMPCNKFIYVEGDALTKKDKLSLALNYIDTQVEEKPNYLIRLDCDDLISPDFLRSFNNIKHCDLYCDRYHICIDPVHLAISYRDADWVANSAVHLYKHAVTPYGPNKEPLFIIDHALYWKEYYAGKSIIYTKKSNPVYYRVLSPFSISRNNTKERNSGIESEYAYYLTGFGPWISLSKHFFIYDQIVKLSDKLKDYRGDHSVIFKLVNLLKHCGNIMTKRKFKA